MNLKNAKDESRIVDSEKTESVLKNNNFLLLFIGKFISLMGDQIYVFALGWYILSITKSSAKMGILLAIGLLPAVVIGPFAGVIADRFNRKHIMVLMDMARFAIVMGMAILLGKGLLSIGLLYLGTAVLEICGAVFNPASSALIPNIVEKNQYTQAASLDQLVWSSCVVLGMLTGGLLFGVVGITGIFIINALSFIISGLLVLKIKARKTNRESRQEKRHILKELAFGFNFLRSNKGLYAVYLYFAVLNFFLYPVGNVYIPYIFNVLLKSNSFQLSMVQASFFVGVIFGALVMTKFMDLTKFRRILLKSSFLVIGIELLVSLVVSPVFLGKLSLWTMVIIFVGLSILLGMSMTAFNIQIQVIFQTKVSDDVRGRVSALITALVSGVVPISYLLAGFLANHISIYLIVFSTGILLLLTVGVLSKNNAVREL